MNWDTIGGRWEQLKVEAKKSWGELTDDDLAKTEGNRERLAGAVQERYGYTKEEAERKIDEWADKLVDTIKPGD